MTVQIRNRKLMPNTHIYHKTMKTKKSRRYRTRPKSVQTWNLGDFTKLQFKNMVRAHYRDQERVYMTDMAPVQPDGFGVIRQVILVDDLEWQPFNIVPFAADQWIILSERNYVGMLKVPEPSSMSACIADEVGKSETLQDNIHLRVRLMMEHFFATLKDPVWKDERCHFFYYFACYIVARQVRQVPKLPRWINIKAWRLAMNPLLQYYQMKLEVLYTVMEEENNENEQQEEVTPELSDVAEVLPDLPHPPLPPVAVPQCDFLL